MLCSREQAIQLMCECRDPREILVPEENESAEERKAREELISAIENHEQTFFYFSEQMNREERERVKDVLTSLGYKVLSAGSGRGNAVLFDRRYLNPDKK